MQLYCNNVLQQNYNASHTKKSIGLRAPNPKLDLEQKWSVGQFCGRQKAHRLAKNSILMRDFQKIKNSQT